MKGLLLISAVSLLPAVLGVIDLSTYPLSTVLRQGNGEIYTLHWSFNVQEESIRFAVNVSTTGWVGLGLSPDGGMAGSDIVIGWVNSQGEAFLNDRYATTTGRPPIDAEQNWFLDEGMEESGFTLLAFRRQWITCDSPQDREIKIETTRVIFSWNEADPVNDDPNEVMYHGPTNRGSISLNFLGGQQDTPPDPVDVQSFTTTVNNVNVPSSDTTYWCSAFQLPTDVIQQKHFVTKVSPVITENNELNVHHILVFECDRLNNSHVGYSAPCDGQSDGDVGNMVSECRGGTLIAGWAVGGTDFVFPADVAYPIGGPGASRYLVMETHYDNPSLRLDIIDSSGMEFFYTSIPRTYESGILQIGHAVTPLMIIPPGTTEYVVLGDCNSECTSNYFPPGGINIFANLLHTHLAGVGVTLQHIRRNQQCDVTEELEPIEDNQSYDFNYQQNTFLPRIINVQSGDILRVECKYTTAGGGGVVLGGEATSEEMCLAFPAYYPRTNLSACLSTPNHMDTGFLQPFITNHVPRSALPQLVTDFESALNQVEWTPDAVDSLKSSVENGPTVDICVPQNYEGFEDIQIYPYVGREEVQCDYQAADVCTGFQPTPCCSRVGGGAVCLTGEHLTTVVLLLFALALMFA